MQPDSWRAGKQSSTQRGYGYAWQKARAAFLASHPFCLFCLRELGIADASPEEIILECAARRIGAPYATVVDHSTPHRGDMTLFWDNSRWQSLCAHHHSADKQAQESAAR